MCAVRNLQNALTAFTNRHHHQAFVVLDRSALAGRALGLRREPGGARLAPSASIARSESPEGIPVLAVGQPKLRCVVLRVV
jgi:hypothetical protein